MSGFRVNGAWNASIVAEVVDFGHHHLVATGLGAYIAHATATGDTGKIFVGVAVMSVYVVAINRLFWRRLYRLAEPATRCDPCRRHRHLPDPARGGTDEHRHHPPAEHRAHPAERPHHGRARDQDVHHPRRAGPAGPRRHHLRPARRRDRRPARQVRLRQVDAASVHRRADRPLRGHRHLPRHPAEWREPRGGHGVPVLRPAALADRPTKRRTRPAGPRRTRNRAARAGTQGHRHHRPGRVRIRLPPRTLRRHAPTRRLRPRPGGTTRRAADGRALLRPGRADRPEPAHRTDPAMGRPRIPHQGRPDRHPQHRRSCPTRRPGARALLQPGPH